MRGRKREPTEPEAEAFSIDVDEALLAEALAAVERRSRETERRIVEEAPTDQDLVVASPVEVAVPEPTPAAPSARPGGKRGRHSAQALQEAARKLAALTGGGLPAAQPAGDPGVPPAGPVRGGDGSPQPAAEQVLPPPVDTPVTAPASVEAGEVPTLVESGSDDPVEAMSSTTASGATTAPSPGGSSPSRTETDETLAPQVTELEARLAEAEKAFIEAQSVATLRRQDERTTLEARLEEVQSAWERERRAQQAMVAELEAALGAERDAHVATAAELESITSFLRDAESLKDEVVRLRRELAAQKDENRIVKSEVLRKEMEIGRVREEAARLEQEAKRDRSEVERLVQALSEERREGRARRLSAEQVVRALQQRVDEKDQEMDLVQRRASRDVQSARQFGHENTVKEVLPILDDLERALRLADAAPEQVALGVQMVVRQFYRAFSRLGVEKIPAGTDMPFDPAIHEAMTYLVSVDHAPGAVLTELRSGFQLNGRLLRAAQVVVAQAPVPAEVVVDVPEPATPLEDEPVTPPTAEE